MHEIDPYLYCQSVDEQHVRINGCDADNLLRAGEDEWQTHLDVTLEQLETTRNQKAPLTFSGMHTT